MKMLRVSRAAVLRSVLEIRPLIGRLLSTVAYAPPSPPLAPSLASSSPTTADALKQWAETNTACRSATMPPNAIYHCPQFHAIENRPNGVLRQHWTYVGHTSQFSALRAPGATKADAAIATTTPESTSEGTAAAEPSAASDSSSSPSSPSPSSSSAPPSSGEYITATLGHNLPVIITSELRGFINLCRHRAAVLLDKDERDRAGTGCGSFGSAIVCRYHGWQYTGEGRLARAVSMKGVEGFSPRSNGLLPIEVATLGPLIFARCTLSELPPPAPSRTRGSREPQPEVPTTSPFPLSSTHSQASPPLSPVPPLYLSPLAATFPQLPSLLGDLSSHVFVSRHSYDIKCNWKVFADNYLDGGYHISRLHPGLASQLALSSYRSTLHDLFSVQTCDAVPPEQRHLAGNEVPERVGSPVYAWLFPTTAINKYGPWMDVHTVQPTSPTTCTVTFDYFVQRPFLAGLTPETLAAQLRASCDVQREDIDICERVQAGLSSGGYYPGRYAAPESPSHHFHMLLAKHI